MSVLTITHAGGVRVGFRGGERKTYAGSVEVEQEGQDSQKEQHFWMAAKRLCRKRTWSVSMVVVLERAHSVAHLALMLVLADGGDGY